MTRLLSNSVEKGSTKIFTCAFEKNFDLQYHFLGFKNFKCRFFAVFRLNVPEKSSFLLITSAKNNIFWKKSVIVS